MKEGWQTKRLGDVATLQRGFDLPTRNRVHGEFPLVSSSGIIDTHHEGPVKAPGVATGRSGSIGNVFYVEKDFWPLNTVLFVKDFHGNNPRFVFHLLRKFDLTRFASGAGVPTLNRNFVHDETVVVPSLSEQRRIVGILDEAFAGIATAKAAAEKNLQNAHALFESHLNAVFTQRGEGWNEKLLGDVSGFQGGSQPPKSTFSTTCKNGYVRLLQIRDFKTDDKAVYIAMSPKNRVCSNDDIMIGRYGASVGQIHRGKSGAYNVALIKTIPDEATIDRDFFYYYLTSSLFQQPLLTVAGSRSAQAGFSKTDIADYLVPLPPLPKQRQIVGQLDGLSQGTQQLESIYKRKLAALDALKKSLLHQAFSGQL
jgi:type I restriction enzyme S subunit